MYHTVLFFILNRNHTNRICKNSCICRAQHCSVSMNSEYLCGFTCIMRLNESKPHLSLSGASSHDEV